MKKTLTVNLGGTVFHIDEDAYRLLDNYLNNLRLHFSREQSADEIVDDIERRISELFSEKLQTGAQVITIADVEEVIARMGKPEEMESDSADEGCSEAGASGSGSQSDKNGAASKVHRRLFRNPDNKMWGGVVSGLAAYLGWDVTWMRIILLVFMMLGYGSLFIVYLVCWLVIPEARTAAEKLAMRGEAVTVENIGRTVTDGFERATSGVNDYVRSGKPRTQLQRIGDIFVSVCVWIMKICVVILAVVCSPVLFALAIAFVALLFAAVVMAFCGGAFLFNEWLPASSLSMVVLYLSALLAVGIPLFALVWGILSQLFRWQPMVSGLKWTLLILWFVSCVCFGVCFGMNGGVIKL